MREIKFRVFFNATRTMYYKRFGDVYGDDLNTIINDFNERQELMQFTGLKDKNEKDIFEGDIVKIDVAYRDDYEYINKNEVYNHNIKTVHILVEFEDGCFQLASDKIPCDKKMLWMWDNELEVIGNVFENSELLEKD